MFGWLKAEKKPAAPLTAMGVLEAYTKLLDRWKGQVVDASLLPAPKQEIKNIIKAMFATPPPHNPPPQVQEQLSRLFISLPSFQPGVGPRPLTTDYPNARNMDVNSHWCKITANAHDELDAINAEWNHFLMVDIRDVREQLRKKIEDYKE